MFTFEGNTYSLAEMLAVNGDDPEFCAWLRTALVGEQFMFCECVQAPDELVAVDSALGELLGE